MSNFYHGAWARLLKQDLIYFIQGEITKRIKIGRTKQMLEERIISLQCGSPDKLIFLGGLLANKQKETELHYKFKKYRLHGEWFEHNQDLIEFIELNTLKALEAIYYVDQDIFYGHYTFEDALEVGTEKLVEDRENRNMQIFEKMFNEL